MVAHFRRNLSRLPPSPLAGPRRFYSSRLALSVWTFAEGSFLGAFGSEICGAFVTGDCYWPRHLVLRLALWPRMVCGSRAPHHRGNFADSAEVVAMTANLCGWIVEVSVKLLK